MRFFIYLLSLLLVALSTNGLGLPPGWRCGTKSCDTGMKDGEDSRINHRAVSNTTATDTAVNNTAVTGRPITGTGTHGSPSCGWWCAAKKRQINNPNISNEASAFRPSGSVTSCGLWCQAKKRQINKTNISKKANRKRQIEDNNPKDTAINNTAATITPIYDGPQRGCGWWCHAKKRQINKSNISKKVSTKRQIENNNLNNTAINNTTVTTTPENHLPWWSCNIWCQAKKRQINNSKKASTKRQIDLVTSGASE